MSVKSGLQLPRFGKQPQLKYQRKHFNTHRCYILRDKKKKSAIISNNVISPWVLKFSYLSEIKFFTLRRMLSFNIRLCSRSNVRANMKCDENIT